MNLFLRLGILVILLSACAPSPTSTPGPTIRPTKTLAPRPTSTPTQKPVSIHACVTNSTIRIRRGPGKQYEQIGGMVSGTCMSILGRSQESDWVYVVSEDNKSGWVAASLLTIEGDLQQVSVQSPDEALSMAPTMAPTAKAVPTQKLPPTSTRKPLIIPTKTPKPLLDRFVISCSDMANRIGEQVSCKIPRAYCDYRPDVNSSPTFCNDRPYPNQNFAMVVFGADWSDFDGECIIVSGLVSLYRGIPQIQATRRSQITYC